MSPANAASVIAAIDVMHDEPERIKNLWDNTWYTINCLKELGFEVGKTETPIIPIYIRDEAKTFILSQLLLENGVFVNPVTSPAVARQDCMIRLSLMATHSRLQIDQAINTIFNLANQLEILAQ